MMLISAVATAPSKKVLTSNSNAEASRTRLCQIRGDYNMSITDEQWKRRSAVKFVIFRRPMLQEDEGWTEYKTWCPDEESVTEWLDRNSGPGKYFHRSDFAVYPVGEPK
jgi:hypothetical protein